MGKQYIRVHDIVDAELRQLQGALLREFITEASYTKVVNMVLIAGLLAADKLDSGDWAVIRKYWQGETQDVPINGQGDVAVARVKQAA